MRRGIDEGKSVKTNFPKKFTMYSVIYCKGTSTANSFKIRFLFNLTVNLQMIYGCEGANTSQSNFSVINFTFVVFTKQLFCMLQCKYSFVLCETGLSQDALEATLYS